MAIFNFGSVRLTKEQRKWFDWKVEEKIEQGGFVTQLGIDKAKITFLIEKFENKVSQSDRTSLCFLVV